MKSLRGNRRRLTDAQVEQVLKWSKPYAAYRTHLEGKTTLARLNNVSVGTIDYVLSRGPDYEVPGLFDSRPGRRPIIRDVARREAILAWQARALELEAALGGIITVEQIAHVFHVSPETVRNVIRRDGVYKQVSPEQREIEAERRRRHIARLRALDLYPPKSY